MIGNLADMQLFSKFKKKNLSFVVLLILIVNMPGLFLWKIKKVDDTMITAETKYSINFSRSHRKFCLSNSFLFVNVTKVYQFKAKDSDIRNICCA